MHIKCIAHAVPDTAYAASEIAEWTGADETFIKEKVGAVNRYYLGEDETGVELANKAVCKLLDEQSLTIDQIGLLIYVTQTPDYAIPHNSAVLHAMLDGPDNMACFDVSLGCSGYPYALSIAKSMMVGEEIERAIVVTCDPYSKIMNRHDKATVSVFGDAATASLLAADGHITIGKADFGTRGKSGKDSLLLAKGHAATPIRSIHSDEPTVDAEDPAGYQLFMNGRNVFNFVMTEVPLSLDRMLEKNSLSKDDIDRFALHQGSIYMLKNLTRRYGIDQAKVVFNIQDYGNTVSSSVPLAVEKVMRDDPSFTGKVAISGFGVGLSWASNVLHFNKQN